MRILVLGHSGYLGGHVARELRALPGVQFIGGGRGPSADLAVDLATITPGPLAERLFSFAPDAVINCAGAVGPQPVALAELNARAPAVLCAALREAAPTARLVHFGSAAEYGPTGIGERVTEQSAARPTTLYGATKLAGTVAVTSCGLDAVVLRITNPVGPGAPAAGLPGRLARQLRDLGPRSSVRLGDLSAHRDFVDARDVAHAAVLAATGGTPLPPVLNISHGQAVPVRELVRELAHAAGFRGRIEEDAAGSVRSSDVPWQCSDPGAARTALGWSARRSLADSVAALWAAVRAEPDREPVH
ncbi:NAD-dependent epimerase/dehydratase family protein [Streptomyces sp. NPDC048416]|uniref:NAD-dependent epimerase/dehydratase family protein n=1 Tax=Streptomyces sp. NPDC048416 TaxID=3365546 RepID=UPI0037237036